MAQPGQPVSFNPLFLHASVGLGKTHLLQAIAWEAKKSNPTAKVLYLTAERFMYSASCRRSRASRHSISRIPCATSTFC